VQRIELTDPQGVRWLPDEPARSGGDGVLVLAGSSGRVDAERARLFAERGLLAESIRWFGGPGQSPGPWRVPLETFLRRVDALAALCARVWVVGTSFGAEAALLTGAFSPSVAGVVAFAPSDVVWAGYDADGAEHSHWTLEGAPLPFVPVAWDRYVARDDPPRFRPLYEASRVAFPERAASAAIPVERIARLVLVAGGDDQVWPSTEHAERIRARRAAAGADTVVVERADAGHRAILPGEPVVTAGAAMARGGTEAADRALGAAAWPAILAMMGLG
jgi:uncharacterized protein